jgi:CRISPR system Cascade subunit CasA
MTDAVRHSLLEESLLSVGDAAGRRTQRLSLPALYAALVRGEVEDFPALRPHQRHVWHAFLVQVGALALQRARLSEPPDEAPAWRALLLALTPNDQDGAAWALVAPHERPALLQPPVPGGDVSKFKVIETADALDMLVTAKNHDVKRTSMRTSRPEHWVYALVSLQTQEGFFGAGNYGISRMNGGFASRPGLGIGLAGGQGLRILRDLRQLLRIRARTLENFPFYPSVDGLGLLWLVPWDGNTSLSPGRLDPFYIEVCRRVRLVITDGGRVGAMVAGSAVARVDAKSLNGRTGDPWTPLVAHEEGRKALTMDAGGFTYKRLVPLVFPSQTDPLAPIRAPLQEWAPEDPERGVEIVARAVVRGQGRTEGVHERRIPLSKTIRPFLGPLGATDFAARIASERVTDAGLVAGKVLYPARLAVFTAAPSAGERRRDDDTAKSRVRGALSHFDVDVDATFFPDLEAELEFSDDSVARERVRAVWLLHLRAAGRRVLDESLAAAPTAAMRNYRTRVRAHARFEGAFRRLFGHRVPEFEPLAADGASTPTAHA